MGSAKDSGSVPRWRETGPRMFSMKATVIRPPEVVLHMVIGRDLHYNQLGSAVKAQRLLTSDSEAKSESTNCYHSSA